MIHLVRKFTAYVLTALFCVVAMADTGFAQIAPRVSTSRAGDYVRLSFGWGEATTMQVVPQGKAIQITFSNPVGADIAAITSRLSPYVVGIIRSPDGKTITLSLTQPLRVRHFVSGNTTGLDILTSTPPQPIAAPKPAPAPASPPALAKPKPVPAPQPTPAPAKKPEPAKPAIKKPEPEKAAPLTAIKPREGSVLTTKKPVTAEEEKPIKEAPAPEKKPEEPAPPKEEKALNNAKAEPAKPEKEPEATPPKEEEKKPAAKATPVAEEKAPPATTPAPPPAKAGPQGDLQIGIIPGDDGPTLEFPWNARTALATFQREKDIWLLFDRASTIDMARLTSIMPNGVTAVKRFHLPNHTVLRLSTDKPLYPHVTTERGTYRWRVQLSEAPAMPLNDTEMFPSADTGDTQLVFKLFDVADPVSFYDPTVGDRWLLAPAYESGRGFSATHRYPGFVVEQTSQGLVVRTEDDGLTLARTRAGIKLSRAGGLAVSEKLPFLPGQRTVNTLGSQSKNVILAYDKYFLPDASLDQMRQDIMQRLVRAVDGTARADLLRQLAGMYVAQGFGPEASTILTEIRTLYPDYYTKEHLAVMQAASAFIADRMAEAAYYINDASLADVKEAALWRDAIGLFATMTPPAPKTEEKPKDETSDTPEDAKEKEEAAPAPVTIMLTPTFDYLHYSTDFLNYYPPRLRQRLAVVAADRYLQLGDAAAAVKVFDQLNEDGILKPVQPYAEYLFGEVAASRDRPEQALKTWKRLIDEDKDTYITARARFSTITLKYSQGMIPLDEAIRQLNGLRMAWRGDNLERELLSYLGQLYVDNAQYDEALRIWKELLIAFPNDPATLDITTKMASLFERLYSEGLADEMEPLKSLALFYEFRDLTPVGSRGDVMIQKLADRLAAVDLLDRAIQLLEHQVKQRTEGLDRARVGARLALLYLIDNKPANALNALESSNYGDMTEELRRLRVQLAAQALAKNHQESEALATLSDDTTPRGEQLKLDILWQMQDWPSVINQAEDMLALRKDLTKPLSRQEQEILIQLALAYSFEKDYTQLSYLRDYYLNLIPKDSEFKDTFTYLTNDTAPLDADDVALLTNQISHTQNFLSSFRDAVSKGELSSATNQ